ncbi:tRNA threonylcarbamoyladenosine dehydratase [Anoxybacterium hadale]|uniref:tRNA threonylcarbamoyladenosine dehydratase n=1 Tax=Anoxybacterium hadale TaxID=3408580 RepID=A0ACD1A8A7_9FIRM|nr:tRNA threonylcarbamoyladenosine dehydratase [Clostridiales bacterium]
MKNIYERTQMLLGADMLRKIQSKKVIVFGMGGVGSYAAEALIRAGIRNITMVDDDIVEPSDLNRMVAALRSTIGRKKIDVMEERLWDINPDVTVTKLDQRLDASSLAGFPLEDYDYIIDAIDELPEKILLIQAAVKARTSLISVMNTGNRFDPVKLRIGDIRKASVCTMAKNIRKELAGLGIKQQKVLFSIEEPHREEINEDEPGVSSSISFVPSAAGILVAAEAVKDLIFTVPGDKLLFGIKKPAERFRVE